MTNTVAVILGSVSIITSVLLTCVNCSHTTYNCDSVFFNEFPLSVQKECIILLENDIKELIKRELHKSSKKRHIQV